MFLFKKRYWLTITLLLTTFLVVKNFPAAWVIYGVQKAAPGLQVSSVNGSLWEGRADYSQWVDRGHALPLGQLAWRLNGLSLLSLNPCINFSTLTSGQSLKGDVCYSLLSGKAVASDVDANLPVSRIAPFFSVDLGGDVDIYIQKATWQNQRLGETELSLLWQRASLFNGNQWLALGNIQGRAQDDGSGGLSSQWNHVEDAQQASSPVELDLIVSVTQLAQPKPVLKVSGTIASRERNASSRAGLNQMLQFIGEPVGDGSYRINIKE
ncbi:MAG: hypothetical protein ACJAUP_003512 [Cellvibrionaceae bacterium]|jgi:hypothetical protein